MKIMRRMKRLVQKKPQKEKIILKLMGASAVLSERLRERVHGYVEPLMVRMREAYLAPELEPAFAQGFWCLAEIVLQNTRPLHAPQLSRARLDELFEQWR